MKRVLKLLPLERTWSAKRKRLGHSVRLRSRQQTALVDLSQQALAVSDLQLLLDRAVSLLADTLRVEYCNVLELLSNGQALRLRAGVGWAPGVVGAATLSAETESQAGFTLLSGKPVVVRDLRSERRFSGPPLLHDHDVTSGLSVVIRGQHAPFGVLGVHSTGHRRFGAEDVRFLQAAANVLGQAIQRRRAEEALQRSEERYRSLVENLNDVIFTCDAEGILTYVSPAIEHISEYTSEEITRQPFSRLIHSDDLPRVRASFQRTLNGQLEPAEFRVFDKHDRIRHIRTSSRPQFEGGRLAGMSGIITDITERKRAEEKTAVLLQIAKDTSGTLDVEQLFDIVQQRTAQLLPCDAVITFYLDQKYGVLRPRAHHGVPAEHVAAVEGLEFPISYLFGGRRIDGETIVVNDLRQLSPAVAELFEWFEITMLLAAPMRVSGDYVGALVAIRTQPALPFEPSQVELCAGIAGQLAIAVHAAELYHAQQDEAEVSGALRRVAQELIASVNTPALPDRLCQLSAEVLGCDCSHTFLWQSECDAYVPVSGYGDTPEQWESFRVLRLPRAMLAPLLAELAANDVIQVDMACAPAFFPAVVSRQYDVACGMYMALRRGEEVVGVQAVGRRHRRQRFTARQERIARGLAQTASLALQNARLIQELERANRLKSDFVATMSHELRTPLNIIMGYNHLLRTGEFGPLNAEQMDTLGHMDKSAYALLELINSTLDLSRLEAGEQPLELNDVALPQLVRQIEEETYELRQKPGLQFVWDVAPNLTPLCTDAVKLKVVLKNLITNAVKFTPEGRVTVGIRQQTGGVEISVSDTGVGIPPEIVPIIFEPFRQGERAMTRSFGGVGLGLYIVRRLLDVLGGTIRVASEPGRGSSFQVWLPRQPETADE